MSVRLLCVLVAGCVALSEQYTIHVRFSSGFGSHYESNHNFPVSLVSKSGSACSGTPIKSPRKDKVYHSTGDCSFPFSELQKVRLVAPGTDGWHVDSVHVFYPKDVDGLEGDWVQWWVPSASSYNSWVDVDPAKPQYADVTWEEQVEQSLHRLTARLTTGNKNDYESDDTYSVKFVSDDGGVECTAGHVSKPNKKQKYIVQGSSCSSFGSAQLAKVVVQGTNDDMWGVETVHVLRSNPRGGGQVWTLLWVESAKSTSHIVEWITSDPTQKVVTWVRYPVYPTTVKVVTGTVSHAQSGANIKVYLVGDHQCYIGIADSPSKSEVFVFNALTCQIPRDELNAVRFITTSTDGWYIEHVKVLAGTEWFNYYHVSSTGSPSGWIDAPHASERNWVPGDSPSVSTTSVNVKKLGDLKAGLAKVFGHSGAVIYSASDVNEGVQAWGPGGVIPGGSTITFDFPQRAPVHGDILDCYVYVYRCLPCSNKNNGNIPGRLVAGGWEPGACSPTFKLQKNGYEHRSVAFRTQLSRGEEVKITTSSDEEATFVLFGLKEEGVRCDYASSEGDCPDSCLWDGVSDKCLANWCGMRHLAVLPALPTTCPVCAQSELP